MTRHDQLDLFGGAVPLVSEPGAVARIAEQERASVRPATRHALPVEALPLLLLRGGTWCGPGAWFMLRYRVLGVTTAGPDQPVEAGAFEWFPSRGAALTEAGRRATAGGKVSAVASVPGLFGVERARAWALAVAGYAVEGWGNGVQVVYVTEADVERFELRGYLQDGDPAGEGWRRYFAHEISDEKVDAMVRARGLDPMTGAPLD